MEIDIKKNIYSYGKFYDSDKVKIPEDKGNYDLIVYVHPFSETQRIISSLEGFFISEIPLIEKGDKGVNKEWQLLVRRDEMGKWEEKYKGKFFPFEK